MKQHHMTEPGDTVIVGVSGGADSVCLLLLLKEFEKELSVKLKAVHVHHGLREDAGEDEEYVKQLCERLRVPLKTVHVQAAKYAAREGISCEEAGRVLRYQSFREAGKDEQQAGSSDHVGVKIAVAHHMDDRAETVLFHLFRGTGLAGLVGIRPVREEIIRPLLCVTRSEIEEFLRQENVLYCMDSTNLEDTYTRNKIRHHLLPFAEQEICTRSVEHVVRAAEICMEAEDYLAEETQKSYDRCVILEQRDGHPAGRIVVREFAGEHPVLQKRVLLRLFEELTPYRKDVESVHVEAVRGLLEKAGNKQVFLPYGLRAYRKYDVVVIEKAKPEEEKREPFCFRISQKQLEDEGTWSAEGLSDGKEVVFSLLDAGENQGFPENIPQKPYTKWFDYDKIKESLAIRSRQTGDYLMIHRSGREPAKKTLKEYFIAEKIPRQERDGILLLADGSHIIWVMGHRISEYYKVNQDTKRILQVQLRGEEADG
ncbi:MAG: tRNA lysidine(34) synthetase TilS [Lachnospiraceae bacterium]|nr:tRNA lysidine(34) synthetase TilS [Lachnospiraceae bacterium]